MWPTLKIPVSITLLPEKTWVANCFGWYVEAGYNVLESVQTDHRLVPFIRYEAYNTHAKTDNGLVANKAYDRTDLTVGAGWWMSSGSVLKADYQVFNNGTSDSSMGQLNLGIGIWF